MRNAPRALWKIVRPRRHARGGSRPLIVRFLRKRLCELQLPGRVFVATITHAHRLRAGVTVEVEDTRRDYGETRII